MINEVKIEGIIQGMGAQNKALTYFETQSKAKLIFFYIKNDNLLIKCSAWNAVAQKVVEINKDKHVLIKGEYGILPSKINNSIYEGCIKLTSIELFNKVDDIKEELAQERKDMKEEFSW